MVWLKPSGRKIHSAISGLPFATGGKQRSRSFLGRERILVLRQAAGTGPIFLARVQRVERTGGVRARIPDHLERVEVVVIPPEGQAAPGDFQEISRDTVTQRLDYRPGKIICKCYSLPKDKDLRPHGTIVQASAPPTVEDRGGAEYGARRSQNLVSLERDSEVLVMVVVGLSVGRGTRRSEGGQRAVPSKESRAAEEDLWFNGKRTSGLVPRPLADFPTLSQFHALATVPAHQPMLAGHCSRCSTQAFMPVYKLKTWTPLPRQTWKPLMKKSK